MQATALEIVLAGVDTVEVEDDIAILEVTTGFEVAGGGKMLHLSSLSNTSLTSLFFSFISFSIRSSFIFKSFNSSITGSI